MHEDSCELKDLGIFCLDCDYDSWIKAKDLGEKF